MRFFTISLLGSGVITFIVGVFSMVLGDAVSYIDVVTLFFVLHIYFTHRYEEDN